MRAAALILAAACFAGPASAACDALIVHLGSYHPTGRFHDANVGLGCRSGHLVAGFYHNSEGRVTAYAAASVETSGGGLRPGAFVGLATGYALAPVVPVAGLSLRSGPLVVLLVPGTHVSAPVVHFSVEVAK